MVWRGWRGIYVGVFWQLSGWATEETDWYYESVLRKEASISGKQGKWSRVGVNDVGL